MSSLQLIILAAGRGIRMKSDLPKILHPLCGRPMISYALDLAATSGVKQPIVILGEQADQVMPHLPKEVKVVIQKAPLGTGDAVLATKRTLGHFAGDLVILYADTPLLRRTAIQRLIETHHKTNATCSLLMTHLADPTGYGRIVRDATGIVSGVVEDVEANASQRAIREVNVGPLCVKAQPLFEALASIRPGHVGKEWYLTQAVSLLAKRGGSKFNTVRLEHATDALGVNSRLDLAKAAKVIRQRILESHLNNGVTIVDPETTFIDHGVAIGQDTTIFPGTVIESRVVIGRGCSIGPFARLRSGVVVEDHAHIGNFVELVRTKIGPRVRVNHVTYLGDTTVEEDVNIGAGTITANFDGTSKFPTTIGKGAFIGCDTILIAPVKVGAGAVTGAGAVIPKAHDVPARGVVVGVPARLLEQAPPVKGRLPVRTLQPRASKKPARAAAARRTPKPKKPARRSKAKAAPRKARRPTKATKRKARR